MNRGMLPFRKFSVSDVSEPLALLAQVGPGEVLSVPLPPRVPGRCSVVRDRAPVMWTQEEPSDTSDIILHYHTSITIWHIRHHTSLSNKYHHLTHQISYFIITQVSPSEIRYQISYFIYFIITQVSPSDIRYHTSSSHECHLWCCQSQTMSKSPMPAQAGGEGLVPAVMIWPRLVQLIPRSSLHTVPRITI